MRKSPGHRSAREHRHGGIWHGRRGVGQEDVAAVFGQLATFTDAKVFVETFRSLSFLDSEFS